MGAYYTFLWGVALLNAARCVLQLAQRGDGHAALWNALWLVTRFGMISLEASVVVYLLQGFAAPGEQALRNTLAASGAAAAVDTGVKALLIFVSRVPLYLYDPASDMAWSKWAFWLAHGLAGVAAYGALAALPWTPWREALPARRGFRRYVAALLGLHAALSVGAALVGSKLVGGYCVYGLASWLYYAAWPPLLYATFLSEFLADSELDTDLLLYSEMHEAGCFADDDGGPATFVPRAVWRAHGTKLRALRYVRAAVYLVNVHTVALTLLSCLAVALCQRWCFSYKMDLTLVATGTTFPLIFGIQQAFTRREKALSLIANLRASAICIYLQHRDWAQDEGWPASLGNDRTAAALGCKALLNDLLRDVRSYLTAVTPWESRAEQRLSARHHPELRMLLADTSLGGGASQMSFAAAFESSCRADPAAAALRRCYRGFSRLSVLNERLGLRSGYTRGGEGGLSRTNQYLRMIVANLEELRCLKEYRTPIMMRPRRHGAAAAAAAVTFSLITLLLFHVQQDIEQPFDMEGLDDVFLDGDCFDLAAVAEPAATGGGARARARRGARAARAALRWHHGHADGGAPTRAACRVPRAAAAPSGLSTPRLACFDCGPGSPCGVRGPPDLHAWSLQAQLAGPRLTPQASSALRPVKECGVEGGGGAAGSRPAPQQPQRRPSGTGAASPRRGGSPPPGPAPASAGRLSGAGSLDALAGGAGGGPGLARRSSCGGSCPDGDVPPRPRRASSGEGEALIKAGAHMYSDAR
ncbi:CAND8 [Scenedesmus sp. PABB004]|nr:CAND8 [Scenedesmus sp. PABB004]